MKSSSNSETKLSTPPATSSDDRDAKPSTGHPGDSHNNQKRANTAAKKIEPRPRVEQRRVRDDSLGITIIDGHKILIHNTNKSWKGVLRDFLIALTPLFIMYKICTHPIISQMGEVKKNAPKKLTKDQVFERMARGFTERMKRENEKMWAELEMKERSQRISDFEMVETESISIDEGLEERSCLAPNDGVNDGTGNTCDVSPTLSRVDGKGKVSNAYYIIKDIEQHKYKRKKKSPRKIFSEIGRKGKRR